MDWSWSWKVLQFMLEGLWPCTMLCFNVHTSAGLYLGGLIIRRIFASKIWRAYFWGGLFIGILRYCGLYTIQAKNANRKHLTKKFFRLVNHCLLFFVCLQQSICPGVALSKVLSAAQIPDKYEFTEFNSIARVSNCWVCVCNSLDLEIVFSYLLPKSRSPNVWLSTAMISLLMAITTIQGKLKLTVRNFCGGVVV